MPETTATSFNRPLRPQLITSCVFFISAITVGMSLGHSAVLLPELKSSNSSIIIDEDMESWIASVYAILAPFGCILGGLFCDVWGRKKLGIIGNAFLFLGWLLIVCAQNATTILAGRILEGLSRCELATSVTVLTDELLDPKFRGVVVCGIMTSVSAGIILISCLGTFFHWRVASGVATLFAFASMGLFFFVSESPMWLIRKKKKRRAESVLRYLWGPGKESQVKRELADLTVRLRLGEFEETHSKCQKIFPTVKLIFEARVLKPFLILHFFNLIQVVCGLNLFTYYSIDILTRMNTGIKVLDEKVSNIVVTVLRTATIFCTCFLIPFIGRRKLSMASGIFSFLSTLSLGLVLLSRNIRGDHVISEYVDTYIMFTLTIAFVISMSFGFLIFPSVMIGETQPLHIRGFACGYMFAMNEFVLGGALKIYPQLIKILQIHGLFLLFATSCAICTIFVYLFLPETQGRTLQEIEEYFRQSNILWISRKTLLKHNSTSGETGDDSKNILLKHTNPVQLQDTSK